MSDRMTDEDFAHQEHVHCDIPGTHEDLLDEARRARSEEARLKAENERLREALEQAVNESRALAYLDPDRRLFCEPQLRAALSTDKQGQEAVPDTSTPWLVPPKCNGTITLRHDPANQQYMLAHVVEIAHDQPCPVHPIRAWEPECIYMPKWQDPDWPESCANCGRAKFVHVGPEPEGGE